MTDPDRSRRSDSLSRQESMLVLEQIDLASNAQIAIAPGLRAMGEEATSFRVRSALNRLADRLDQGESLLQVLASLKPSLSPLMRTLIEHGAAIGRVDAVLHWAAEQSRRRRMLRAQLWCALAYPMALTSIAIGIGLAFVVLIVPKFKKIFEDFGTELPFMTQSLIWFSDLAMMCWSQLLYILLPVAVVCVILGAIVGNWGVTRRWSQSIPFLGPLFRLVALADFCSLLAVFVDIQLPIQTAIRLAGQASGDQGIADSSENMAGDIESGRFQPASALHVGMPVVISQMLHEAKSTESLAEALRGLAEIYAASAELNSRAVGVVVEPFILVGTTGGLGLIVVSLFMPLLKLLNDLA